MNAEHPNFWVERAKELAPKLDCAACGATAVEVVEPMSLWQTLRSKVTSEVAFRCAQCGHTIPIPISSARIE